MFDVHLTTIKVIDIENNKVVIDSTFGEKEYVLDKIKNGVKFELPKYKSTLQYQEKNDMHIIIKKRAMIGSNIIMLYIQRFLIHYLH